jgi:hypothetical protein
VVDSVEHLAPAAQALLRDRPRLDSLAGVGRMTAPAEVAWEPYLGRVGDFLDSMSGDDDAAPPRAAIGDALGHWLTERAAEAQGRLESVCAELLVAKDDLTKATENQVALQQKLAQREAELQLVQRAFDALRTRWSVRAALRLVRMLRR